MEEEKVEYMKYTPVIGLEVHVELKTQSKMFCACSADYFGKTPNTNTCPVCLGLPGALPVPNKKAIEWCVMIGLSLNCEIPPFSKFDRKNYFYPDLPKGYQISQYDKPFCINGFLMLDGGKKIGIRRVHMEEDTGKLMHEKDSTFIDFNRSGVPLVEIVTEPDFETVEEVKEYLQKLQQIVRALDVSNADMEKGQMRLEPNISLKKSGSNELPKYKVEVKNINSFNFVVKAVNFEIKRQTEILESGRTPLQETRGFVESSSSTVSQRFKEEAQDYRYFPEPDIPPIRWKQEDIERLKDLIKGKMPEDKIKELIGMGLPKPNASILVSNQIKLKLFNDLVYKTQFIGKGKMKPNPNQIANYVINRETEGKTIPQILHAIQSSLVLSSVSDQEIENAAEKIIKENPKAVSDYKKGKETAIMFLVGVVMRSLKVKADANKIKAVLTAKLK